MNCRFAVWYLKSYCAIRFIKDLDGYFARINSKGNIKEAELYSEPAKSQKQILYPKKRLRNRKRSVMTDRHGQPTQGLDEQTLIGITDVYMSVDRDKKSSEGATRFFPI